MLTGRLKGEINRKIPLPFLNLQRFSQSQYWTHGHISALMIWIITVFLPPYPFVNLQQKLRFLSARIIYVEVFKNFIRFFPTVNSFKGIYNFYCFFVTFLAFF